MSMQQLSAHILAVAHRQHLSVTNLQLQKVMYFTLRDYLTSLPQPDDFIYRLYDTPFQTWQYGPVEPVSYERFSHYGSLPIKDNGQYQSPYGVFDQAINQYLREHVFDLVVRSQAAPFWQEHFGLKRQCWAYSLTDIARR